MGLCRQQCSAELAYWFNADENGRAALTIAATTPFDQTEPTVAPRSRAVGMLAIASGLAALALLASHPGGTAQTFSDVLKNETANRLLDGIVHGGFIAVLGLQLVCYSVFSARLGLSRATAIAGLVFFAMGAAFLSGSMVIDGLATPAIAARYLAVPAKLEYARSLFVLMGTLVSFLMPIGLMFQSAAIIAWGGALTASGMARLIGVLGMAAGTVMLAASASSFVAPSPLVLMVTIAGTAAWSLAVGAVLMRARA